MSYLPLPIQPWVDLDWMTHVLRRHQIPEWVKDEEGKVLQKKMWDGVAKELNQVAPGCVERALS